MGQKRREKNKKKERNKNKDIRVDLKEPDLTLKWFLSEMRNSCI